MHSLLTALVDSPVPALLAFSPLDVWGMAWFYLQIFIGFSFIIFIHELGHFVVAKWAGVKVEQLRGRFLAARCGGFTRGRNALLVQYPAAAGRIRQDARAGGFRGRYDGASFRFTDDPRSFIEQVRWASGHGDRVRRRHYEPRACGRFFCS